MEIQINHSANDTNLSIILLKLEPRVHLEPPAARLSLVSRLKLLTKRQTDKRTDNKAAPEQRRTDCFQQELSILVEIVDVVVVVVVIINAIANIIAVIAIISVVAVDVVRFEV